MQQQLARGEFPAIADLQMAIHIAANALTKNDETSRYILH